MRLRPLLAIFAFIISIGVASVHRESAAATHDDVQFELPLDHGRLHVRDVLLRVCDELGVEAAQSIHNIDWSIDVTSTLGRLQLNVLDRLADGAFTTSVDDQRVTVTVDRAVLQQRISEAGQSLASCMADLTGSVREHKPQTFGLTFATDANPRTPLADMIDPPPCVVILVHGLDDPGLIWRDLIPHVRAAGLTVAEFHYPNDGPISESADLLASVLAELRQRGVTHVDIVAHSMGGLVARDVLTRPAYYHGDASGGDRFPAVDRFIMSGTPNHGAVMARLRGIGEVADHLYRLFNNGRIALDGSFDGSGEAGADLLPDSDFLRRLNARPLPANTRITIIAAQWSAVDGESIRSFADHVRKLAESGNAPDWMRDLVSESNADAAATLMTEAVNGLGDGCVTVKSAKLEGVDDVQIVRGNHVSMILNIIPSDDVPPAISLILDRLRASEW
jgi:pimeloyl-ACP methyl ester carboxylesterase